MTITHHKAIAGAVKTLCKVATKAAAIALAGKLPAAWAKGTAIGYTVKTLDGPEYWVLTIN